MRIGVVIPALNEAGSVGAVITRCLSQRHASDQMRVVVCDNGSSDGTADIARRHGAEVIHEVKRGYGTACLRALEVLGEWPEALVFIDADGSSRPEEMERLLAPIRSTEADAVIGRRRPSLKTMTWPQILGGRLAVSLIAWRWGIRYRDLGPFRAIRKQAYDRLGMADQTWGWTIEMQIKIILYRIRFREISVSWLPRTAGKSKISGTLMGVLRAGTRILWTFVRYVRNDPGKLPRKRLGTICSDSGARSS
ncbi:MAG: glycosyltransferase [bacterium]|nr:glycosyltransferase [bacterium]